MTASATARQYDVIVVGSGANGGVAAMELAERGIETLVLEAGPDNNPAYSLGHAIRGQLKHGVRHFISRRQRVQEMHPGYWECNPDLFVDDTEHPYTHPKDKPFHWIRGRQVGGRSLTWGGLTLRMSDYEFQAASRDGYGANWPIRHADLDSYYARLERFFNVHGSIESLPQIPDGDFQSPSLLTPAEQVLKQSVEAKWPDRRLIVARGIRSDRSHPPPRETAWPSLSSPGTSLRQALDSGHATLRADAIVTHLIFDHESRRARGVRFIDRRTKTCHEGAARVVVLCASTIETLRILLASTRQRQAEGFDEPSGLLGTHLMDHISVSTNVFIPGIPEPKDEFKLLGSDGMLIPRFQNIGERNEDFIRGYGIWGGLQRFSILPDLLRKIGTGAIGFLVAHGEVLPRKENCVTLDDNVVDAWGIPAPHIQCSWSDNEYAMARDMQARIEETMAAAKGRCVKSTDLYRMPPLVRGQLTAIEEAMALTTPGLYVHEVGGARMGDSPDSSVVNSRNQLWNAPNVFVTDGACWVTSGWQNPTLTEMAITARACDYLAVEMKEGRL